MRVLSVSVTEAGRALAVRLPYEHVCGRRAGDVVRARWSDVDAFVLFLATGASVRIVAPLLRDKATDPGVVCVDEAGRFAVALCGGHAGGANGLARTVAEVLGATPVVTTATDAGAGPSLDQLPGFVATGDVAGVTRTMLDGRPPRVENVLHWPLPGVLAPSGPGPERLVVTDRVVPPSGGVVALHPPSLVAGVGASTGAPPDAAKRLLDAALAQAGLVAASVGEVATIDRRAADPAVVALGLPVRAFSPQALAAVVVPSPSEVVRAAVGTASVAEAAALLAAGPGAELVIRKQVGAQATVAVARRRRPRGLLQVVGLGPGGAAHRTPAAELAVRRAEVVIGYGPYADACQDLLTASQEVVRSPIGDETVRAKQAVADAAAGRCVALVCSGDPGVYAMASLALELAGGAVEVEVVPGVTAALAAAALLGAPLGHDHATISLSDLLTPWPAIEARLRAAADADLVVALYNPRSSARSWQFDAARTILLERRSPSTPVGVVTDAARPGQSVHLDTLGDVDSSHVGMTTCVIVGSSTTRVVAGRMLTPRGYTP